MTRHFVWLVPLINLALFLGIGVLLALATRRWPRRAGWLSPRLIITLAILPALTLAGRRIYLGGLVAGRAGDRVAPGPGAGTASGPRAAAAGAELPVLLGLVLLQAGWIVGGDRIKRWREEGRPLPPAGSPNVLLIVLDTVRADHLSLYGYPRPTTPHLERLARRGIRFDRARAAAPWTLASHANMFTGRWPHELDIEWTCPLRADVPTLAEHLGSLGYATAGFAGNTFYCSYDSGLDRGFAHYEDYVLDGLERGPDGQDAERGAEADRPSSAGSCRSRIGRRWRSPRASGRTPASSIASSSTGCRGVGEPRRPFFAFLNYVDAHAPYLLPPGAPHRFGPAPMTEAEMRFLAEGWTEADQRRFPRAARRLVRDAYDNCLAYLDERLGDLIDDLGRRGVLDQTLVIVTADHGEGLGEHELFEHGESLYRTEIRVPLLIVLPADRGRSPAPAVVDAPVSLRDIAATDRRLRPPGDGVAVPGPVVARRPGPRGADRRAGASDADDRRALRAGVAQPVRSEPGPIARPIAAR